MGVGKIRQKEKIIRAVENMNQEVKMKYE